MVHETFYNHHLYHLPPLCADYISFRQPSACLTSPYYIFITFCLLHLFLSIHFNIAGILLFPYWHFSITTFSMMHTALPTQCYSPTNTFTIYLTNIRYIIHLIPPRPLSHSHTTLSHTLCPLPSRLRTLFVSLYYLFPPSLSLLPYSPLCPLFYPLPSSFLCLLSYLLIFCTSLPFSPSPSPSLYTFLVSLFSPPLIFLQYFNFLIFYHPFTFPIYPTISPSIHAFSPLYLLFTTLLYLSFAHTFLLILPYIYPIKFSVTHFFEIFHKLS